MMTPQEVMKTYRCEDNPIAALLDITEIMFLQADARADLEEKLAAAEARNAELSRVFDELLARSKKALEHAETELARLRAYAPYPFDNSLPTYRQMVEQLAETEGELECAYRSRDYLMARVRALTPTKPAERDKFRDVVVNLRNDLVNGQWNTCGDHEVCDLRWNRGQLRYLEELLAAPAAKGM